MNIKKVFRIIGKVLLILLLLIILLILLTTTVYHIKLNKPEMQLKEADYYHPVSVGDHSLNIYACGNENGQHTVIALAGYGDGEMFLGWRQMTAEIEKDNRLIFLDRAGYFASVPNCSCGIYILSASQEFRFKGRCLYLDDKRCSQGIF